MRGSDRAPASGQGAPRRHIAALKGSRLRPVRFRPTVPASVRVPAGASQAILAVTLHHAHEGLAAANLTATFGGAEAQAAVTVLPIAGQGSSAAKAAAPRPHHDHSSQPPVKPPGR